jgi:peptidoglycan/LPS O-acetylase OafA/YrhL
MRERSRQEGGRIACLDGLRAVSIGLVLLGHLRGTRGFAPSLVPAGGAELGVRVFFVISGFLITSLLLKEWERTRTISIREFYVRRVYRIFPAFYVFFGCVLLLQALSLLHLQPHDALAAATYTVNYHPQRSWWIGHLWSLSVEEQFYLLWPLLLRLAGPERGVWAATAAVLAAPFVRVGLWVLAPTLRPTIGEAFPTVCDALAIGCVLACLRDRLEASPRYLAFLQARAFLLLPALALLVATTLRRHMAADFLFGQSFCNVAIALFIHRCVRFPGGLPGRVLNARPLVLVGSLSYSLYLWQQLFLNRGAHSLVTAFPLNVALAFAAACASHFLVERTFLRLRERRARRPVAEVGAAPVQGLAAGSLTHFES